MKHAPVLAAALLAAACLPEEGPLMSPGDDCVACHGGGQGEDDARAWTVAGTVFPAVESAKGDGLEGVRVVITDRDGAGRTITLRSNQAGNFYTAERLTPPIRVRLEKDGQTAEMLDPVGYGGCNLCHAQPPEELAPGRLTPFFTPPVP